MTSQLDEIRRILEENFRYTKVIHEFTPKDSSQKQKESLQLFHDHYEYTKACYAVLEKLNKWLFWHKIFALIKFFVFYFPIVAGVILGFIYFPPIFQKFIVPYLEVLQHIKGLEGVIPR